MLVDKNRSISFVCQHSCLVTWLQAMRPTLLALWSYFPNLDHVTFSKDAFYYAFHKHANSKVQKPSSQLRFSLPSIIITITSNGRKKKKHKTDRNLPITDHKPWLSKVLFPKRSVKMIGCSKKHTANVSWFLNFGVRVFLKSAVSHACMCACIAQHLKGTVSEITSHGLQWENKAYKLKRAIVITVSVWHACMLAHTSRRTI